MKRYLLWACALLLLTGCGLAQKYAKTDEYTFEVARAPLLTIDNFAGDVTVRDSESNEIHVVVVRRAAEERDLERIKVDLQPEDGGLTIQIRRPSSLHNVSVDLEISAPAETTLDVQTGAGDVDVRGLYEVRIDSGAGDVDIRDAAGDVQVSVGAGNIDVWDVLGLARLHTGAGDIAFDGDPEGACRFESGAGDIKIVLPDGIDIAVDLSTGVGEIDLALAVAGAVSRQEVKGLVGRGGQGEIYARTGAGDIALRGR